MKADQSKTPDLRNRTVSVVVPVFNERASLDELYRRLADVLAQVASRYEIIFVDDGSRDGSIEKLREISTMDRSVS